MVAAAILTNFAKADADHIRDQIEVIATMLGRKFPKVGAVLRDAAGNVTAFADFPNACWRKIRSAPPSE